MDKEKLQSKNESIRLINIKNNSGWRIGSLPATRYLTPAIFLLHNQLLRLISFCILYFYKISSCSEEFWFYYIAHTGSA